MKKNEFTKEQKNGVIHFLKLREKELTENDPDWVKASKSWKNLYYYPTITARLKLEDDILENFTNNEIITIISCINGYAPSEKEINEIGFEIEKIKEPFSSALKKINNLEK